jgi:hypothetical protein
MKHVLTEYGPLYPKLGSSVAKYRRIPRGAFLRAYGDAVHAAIRALQRSELRRELPSFAPRCASRTWHTDGDSIHKAVQQQQHRALVSSPDKIRRDRTPAEWERLYTEAMKQTATRQRRPTRKAA